MPRYRLLAIDIDGTLVNSQHELSDRTRQAVLRAKRAGVEIVLATGRRYSRVLPLVEPLELNVPLITASGALIKRASDHQTLFQAQFPTRVLEQCLDTIAAHGYEAVLYGDTFHEGFDFYHRDLTTSCRLLTEFFAKNAGFGRVLASIMSAPPPGIFAGFVMGNRHDMHELVAELERALPGELYLHVLRSPRYAGFMCEIAPAGVSKWAGVSSLAAEWGIEAAEICAVGDDVNDIPMIAGAGLGVAMGNAVEETKAAADRIAPTNDEDGLEQVVEWVLE